MNITSFFRDTLGVPLVNSRWSWGAYDPQMDSVFLRVWDDQIFNDAQGDWVQIFWNNPRSVEHGYRERKRHLDALTNGASGYGVVCEAVDPDADAGRQIATFDEKILLVLGERILNEQGMFARIISRVPTCSLTVAKDVLSLNHDDTLDTTTKTALINARLGQGKFRASVFQLWGNRCCVTGSSTGEALRASHIKPWRNATAKERLDPMNGLPLTASLDALFDVGLISFEDTGAIRISPSLSAAESHIFGLIDQRLLRTPSKKTCIYLKHHRLSIFREN